ncbi:MAG: DUF1587 domain-containing protein, partial [Myxococcota bacterium]
MRTLSLVPALGAALLLVACANEVGAPNADFSEFPDPIGDEENEEGRFASNVDGAEAYAALCGSCHGAAGEGVGNSPALNVGSEFAQNYLGQFASLVIYNDESMPFGRPGGCQGREPGRCAYEVSRYIYEEFLGSRVVDEDVRDEIEGGGEIDCTETRYGDRRIKLLTRGEIQRTLQDLLGVSESVVNGLPVDYDFNGFSNQIDGIATQGHVQAYFNLAFDVASWSAARDFADIQGLSCDL